MIPFTPLELQLLIAAAVFLLGCFCIIIGIFVLLRRGYSKEIQSMAMQTAKLGQKGLADDATGLVMSASDLVGAINALVRTANGAAVFLIAVGMIMLAGSYWIISHIDALPF